MDIRIAIVEDEEAAAKKLFEHDKNIRKAISGLTFETEVFLRRA